MIGCESEELEVGGKVSVSEIWERLIERHSELDGLQKHVRIAVNREFVSADDEVEPGDEVALIPPVSGGSGDEVGTEGRYETDGGRFVVTQAEIAAVDIRGHVTRPEAGGIVTFEGVVRDHTDDHDVEFLEYECYGAMALEKLVETRDEAVERWETVRVAIHHRYGRLEIGEVAVAIAVSSPHRAPAFEACSYIIDRLKEIVPIWKKEVGPEGEEWVGWGP